MGMFDKEEHTLFKPQQSRAPSLNDAGPAYRGPMPSASSFGDEDEERASLGELVLFAFNSARRRKGLAIAVTALGLLLTVIAVKLAPRTYVSAGEVLVSKGREEGGGWDPERGKREQLEWEKQIRSREIIKGIVKDARLVERWDDMRQPHRRIKDTLMEKLGEKPPNAEQKYGALIGMLEAQLRLNIDQSTVTIYIEWSDPEAAHDIVDSAIKRFIDKRYESEVSRTLNSIRPIEEQLEAARLELEKLSPSSAPPKEKATQATPVTQLVSADNDKKIDPELPRKLAAARDKQQNAMGKQQELEGQKNARIAQVQNQLTERSTVLGPANPEIMALKMQLEQAQKDTADLTAARAARAQADEEVQSLSAQAGISVPRATVRAYGPAFAPAGKMDDQTAAKIASARALYDEFNQKVKKAQSDLKTEELNFQVKYQISHPPDVPYGPKKPVGMMVSIGGILATLFMVFLLASLRDRATGMFFEAQHVRDRLRLPVLGDFKDQDFTG
jgi:uncharacterized protein involved in exopolysaccharide biosynthesis